MQSFINSNQLFLPLKIVLGTNVCYGVALDYSNNLKIKHYKYAVSSRQHSFRRYQDLLLGKEPFTSNQILTHYITVCSLKSNPQPYWGLPLNPYFGFRDTTIVVQKP